MSLVLVHRDFIGRYPPEPYLISSHDEIDEGETEAAKFHEAWLDKHPFPGVHSTWQAKYDWLKALQKEYMDEFEKSIFTNPPEVWQVASEILLDEAPQTIVVQFYANSTTMRQRAALRWALKSTEGTNFCQAKASAAGRSIKRGFWRTTTMTARSS